AEGPADVADMGLVEHGGVGGRYFCNCIHGSSPYPRSRADGPWRRQTAQASVPASMADFVLSSGLFRKPTIGRYTAKAGAPRAVVQVILLGSGCLQFGH